MEPTSERFVALARSSPWRWRTLRFRVLRGWHQAPFRALVRRPEGLRVETLDGALLKAERQQPRQARLLTSSGRGRVLMRPRPFETTPTFDNDGLVQRRPNEHEADYDDPMLQVTRIEPTQGKSRLSRRAARGLRQMPLPL